MAKQGGLLGHVTVPRTYKAPGSHKVELAYITKKEANKLKELDLHNSGIGKEMHYGPEGIPNYNGGGGGFGGGFDGGGGGRAEVGKDDIREAARTVAAIASASKAAPGALERLGAQRVSAAQSGPRGALGRTPTQRAEPVRAPVSRPAPVVESAAPVSSPAPSRNPYVNPKALTTAGTSLAAVTAAEAAKRAAVSRGLFNPKHGSLMRKAAYEAATGLPGKSIFRAALTPGTLPATWAGFGLPLMMYSSAAQAPTEPTGPPLTNEQMWALSQSLPQQESPILGLLKQLWD